MAEIRKSFYKNIIGNTKETIDAIQRFLEKNSPNQNNNDENEEKTAESINRIIKSVEDEKLSMEIQKIIKNL